MIQILGAPEGLRSFAQIFFVDYNTTNKPIGTDLPIIDIPKNLKG